MSREVFNFTKYSREDEIVVEQTYICWLLSNNESPLLKLMDGGGGGGDVAFIWPWTAAIATHEQVCDV